MLPHRRQQMQMAQLSLISARGFGNKSLRMEAFTFDPTGPLTFEPAVVADPELAELYDELEFKPRPRRRDVIAAQRARGESDSEEDAGDNPDEFDDS